MRLKNLLFFEFSFFAIKRPLLFFKDLDVLNQFTLSLELNQGSVSCAKCHQQDQFVSHGFVYKQLNHGQSQVVGKRLFCANRRQKSGCGSTLRLYLAERIPLLVHSSKQLTAFLLSLLLGNTIKQAYQTATGTQDPRNAFRWLNKLNIQQVNYRAFAYQYCAEKVSKSKAIKAEIKGVLTVIAAIVSLSKQTCADYQLQTQQAFM